RSPSPSSVPFMKSPARKSGPSRRAAAAVLLGLSVLLAAPRPGCGASPQAGTPAREGPPGPPRVVDGPPPPGLAFVHDPGPAGSYFMPQSMGSGAALFDFDQDGLLDVYLLQGAGPGAGATNRLFRQDRKGHFTDVSKGSGLDFAGFCTGVAVG